MTTVILRVQPATGDGQLHGRLEVVGDGVAVAFTDDTELLDLLHAVARPVGPEPTRTDAGSDLNRT